MIIRNIQLGFSNLTEFHDKITVCVDETALTLTFDTGSHRTLLWDGRECGLNEWTAKWEENSAAPVSNTSDQRLDVWLAACNGQNPPETFDV